MLLYGLFDLVVGIEAFVRKGSVGSLLGGGIAGIIVIGCAALAKTQPRVAYITATAVALLVGLRFLPNAIKGEVWPATIISVISLVFALTLVVAHFVAMAKRKREA